MDKIDKIAKDEFIDNCLKKIQTGRMLSIGALFTPFWNTYNFFPQIQINEIKEIRKKVNEKEILKAKEIFTEICVKRYIEGGSKRRNNCVATIKNITQDQLLNGEAKGLKDCIISKLLELYTKEKNLGGIKELSNNFPDIKLLQSTVDKEEKRKDIITILKGGKTCKQDSLIQEAADQLATKLHNDIKTAKIVDLQSHLKLLEKVNYDKTQIQKIAILLLSRYLFDRKSGIAFMIAKKEEEDEYQRNNLIKKYNITLDMLMGQVDNKTIIESQAGLKLKILVGSFTGQEREASDKGMDLLYEIFENNYNKSSYEICTYILDKVNLEIKYKDIEEKKDFIYNKNETNFNTNKFSRIDSMIKQGERKDAIKFANTLCREGNYNNLIITYKKIHNEYRDNLVHIGDLEELLSEIKNSKVNSEKELIKNIIISLIGLYLDFNNKDRPKDRVEKYVNEIDLPKSYICNILLDQQTVFLKNFKHQENREDKIYVSADFFTYIETFPIISEEEKTSSKLSLLVELNKGLLTIGNILHNSDILHTIKNKIIEIYHNGDISGLFNIVDKEKTLTDTEKFVLGYTCEIKNNSQKSTLERVLGALLVDSGKYINIIPLLETLGNRYNISNKIWIEKVFKKSLDIKDFSYAESLLDKYENFLGGTDKKNEIQEKKILEDINTKDLYKIEIKDIGFTKTTTKAFNKKIESTELTTLNLNALVDAFQQTNIELSKATINNIGKKLLEYFNKRDGAQNEHKHVCYILEKTYNKLSDNHFLAGKRLYKYYHSDKQYQKAIDLCEEMLLFSNQLTDTKKEKAISEQRNNNKQTTTKSCYNTNYSHIEKSIQALRPLPAGLYKDTQNILSIGEIEEKFEELYAFSIKYEINQKLIKKMLQLWKEFYIITQNKEGLDKLKTMFGIEKYSIDEIKNQLVNFISDRNNLGVKELEELILFFGMENAADILFQLYPQYKPLGALIIKSILSQYLGNFLLQRNGVRFVDIPETLQLGSNNMKDRIFTVTEKGFINYYTKNKKKNPEKEDRKICKEYLIYTKKEFEKIRPNEKVFDEILDRFNLFLEQILSIDKSDRFIEKLESGRNFPDFLQKLNATEIKSKRRFLIADGMGMGKSLSAILAKEIIGAKNCLVVTPNNVVDTRKNYLSDINNPKEKKQGYFKKGKTPKTLVIQSIEDIKNQNLQNYEYIIISQEKLSNKDYIKSLIDVNFDYMIVDEIHKLKNISKGKRANALLQIAEKIEEKDGHLCLLSGTPIPNKVGDIAMLLKLLYPHEYGNTDNKNLVKSILDGDTLNLRSLLLPRMQMKKMTDHIDMPELYNNYKNLNLSEKEQSYYDIISIDDEMTFGKKIIKLRQFILNPKLLDITDIDTSSKAKEIGKVANESFKEKDKIVFFVNGFIKGILRPTDGISKEETFIAQMGLDKNIEIRIIDGENPNDRSEIQKEFNASNKKIALFISGATADVGIDLTGGEKIIHINEPRTQADKDQQEARVYRYGQKKDIESTTYITNGTIEQGIHEYVKIKQDAIMKLYYGIELSILEKRILESDDPNTSSETSSEKEINKGLSTYFRESAKELNNMYGYMKQGGTTNIENLVIENGEKFAGYYKGLGARSYQANANRRNASLIHKLISKENIQYGNIIDLGSGPKMLYQHIDDELKKYVTSIDINPHHFSQEDIASGKAKISNFLSLPFEDSSVDIVSSSLSFNETSREPKKENYERLECLYEIQRILKKGGVAIISTIYSLQYAKQEELIKILNILGFELYEKYSGNAESGESTNTFHVKTLTIRKKNDIHQPLKDIIKIIKNENLLGGLEMKKDNICIYNQKSILQTVNIGNEKISIDLNSEDDTSFNMEKAYSDITKKREEDFGSLGKIPNKILIENGFARYSTGKSRVLCKYLPNNAGLFNYRRPIKKN